MLLAVHYRVMEHLGSLESTLTCDQASLYFRGGKVRLIQLLDHLSAASPESGLFSDWSRNKRYLELSYNWFPVCPVKEFPRADEFHHDV